MKYQIIFYYYNNGNAIYVDYSDKKNKVLEMDIKEISKFHSFRLMNGYVNTHTDLIKFKNDMINLRNEIKKVEIKTVLSNKYTFDYFKYFSHVDSVYYFWKSKITNELYNSIEETSKEEFYITNRTNNGGLIILNNDYKNKPVNGYGYDYPKFYPNMLLKMKIPIKQGKTYKLKNVEFGKLKYGIYRAKIKTDNKDFLNMFNFSKENHYISSILNYIYKFKDVYNISFELLKPDKDYNYNALIYEYEDLIDGEALFKDWYNELIQMPKNQLSKHLLSSILGTLTSFKNIYVSDDEIPNLDITHRGDIEDSEYKIIDNLDNGYKAVKSNDAYKFSMARIKPFVVGLGRLTMMRLIIKHKLEKNIIRICTDSLILLAPYDFEKNELKQGTKKKDLYIPILENKSTGYINCHNVLHIFHVCKKCNEEYKYNKNIVHECK